MDFQFVIVLMIVAGAGLYFAVPFVRKSTTAKKSDCGKACGCGKS
jgi:hypothetical protein